MTDRVQHISEFLKQAGWGGAAATPLAGDASARRYLRLSMGQDHAVLMDAPPDRGEDIRPFIRIAEHLSGLGLSAPRILAADSDTGFLLLEDLGDALYARVLEIQPDLEAEIYEAALSAQTRLRAAPVPDVPRYGPDQMADAAALVLEWYQPDTARRGLLRSLVRQALVEVWPASDVLVLRDYHAENLLWLPDRFGVARVGQLDFQDAMAGHPLYDPVSLLLDARRDVSADTVAAMKPGLARDLGLTGSELDRAFATLGAQRSLRILGVFARLCLRDGKPGYVRLMPRVWDHLQACLCHPDLTDLADLCAGTLPAPGAAFRTALTERCAS